MKPNSEAQNNIMSQRRQPWNPWPWAIIASFALFIAGTVGLVIMACAQRGDLVSDNYYEEELKFQTQLDRANSAARLGSTASMTYQPERRLILVALPADQAQRQPRGTITFYRPSAAGLDRKVPLKLDSAGRQSIDSTGLQVGPWQVRVAWTAGEQDFFIERKLVIEAEGGAPVHRR